MTDKIDFESDYYAAGCILLYLCGFDIAKNEVM